MLREIKNVKQEGGAGSRRWFESDGLDFVVWLDAGGGVTGFQLCYDLGRGERALTWRMDNGFVHSRVDAGDETPLKNQTPILLADGQVPWAEVARRFDERSRGIDATLRKFVREKIAEQLRAKPR